MDPFRARIYFVLQDEVLTIFIELTASVFRSRCRQRYYSILTFSLHSRDRGEFVALGVLMALLPRTRSVERRNQCLSLCCVTQFISEVGATRNNVNAVFIYFALVFGGKCSKLT